MEESNVQNRGCASNVCLTLGDSNEQVGICGEIMRYGAYVVFCCYGYSEARNAANDPLYHGASVTAPHMQQAYGDSKESAMLMSHFVILVFSANVIPGCDSLKSKLGQ